MKTIAQIRLYPSDGFRGIGPIGLTGDEGPEGAANIFSNFISGIIGLMTVIAVIWFIFLILSGAYAFMSAGGDKAAIEGARKRMTNGLIGLIIIIAAVFLVDIFGTILGLPDILNPAEFINNFTL